MLAVFVGAMFGCLLGCVLQHPVREKLFLTSFLIAAVFGVFTLIGGVPPLIALLFGGSIFVASSLAILVPDSFPIKAFLRRATS